MHNSDNINKNAPESQKAFVKYRRVNANRGAIWLVQAFDLFKSSPGAWFGIVTFILILLLLPVINNLIALLMPVGLGGLMLGCQQKSKSKPLKFDHLFAGIRTDGKELLKLSVIYAVASLMIMLANYYILLSLGIDFDQLIPENADKMTSVELMEWFNGLDQSELIPTLLLAFLVSMALMIPLFMAYWFAPALVVLNKMSATNALKLSFVACKDNFLPFLIYGLAAFGYLILFFLLISVVLAIVPPLAIIVIMVGYLAIFAISLASIYTAYIDIFITSETYLDIDSDNESNSSMLA